jgi:hypothetical protein
LDEVRETGGERGVQEAWRRIWDGCLASDALGTLGEDLREMNSGFVKVTPKDEGIKMMQGKAQYGHQNHRDRQLGKEKVNDHFADPAAFLKSLKNSPWIVAGNVDHSPIMDYLTSFDGTMLKVFSPADLDLWRRIYLVAQIDSETRG